MKAVVIYEPGTVSMDAIMAVFPRHKVIVDAFAARGEVLGIGAFGGGGQGSMGVFKDRAAAEAFVAQDPFVLEGLIAKYKIRPAQHPRGGRSCRGGGEGAGGLTGGGRRGRY